MTEHDDRDGDVEKEARADRLRKRVADLNKPAGDDPERRPGESDAEYVQRRMRELGRKPGKASGSS